MAENTEKTNLREKYPQLFEVFSAELIEFALSEKTARQIANICIEHRVMEKEKVEGIAFRVTYALFGELPKENLVVTFEEGLDIEKEKAENIAKKVDEIIFSNIPSSSQKEGQGKEKSSQALDSTQGKGTKEGEPEEDSRPFDKDAYREPID